MAPESVPASVPEPVPTTLRPVPENWERALAVVAHPDDLEYGAASAIARWTAQGKEITYLLVTAGEAGIDSLPPDRAAAVRKEEQIASAAAVGVDRVEFLAHPDGLVEANLDLRRDLAAAIRRHRPEVLISLNFRETFAAGGFNHVDHRNTGIALLDASRDAANRWVFGGAGGERWDGVRFAVFANSPLATHGVDVGEHLEAGIASLEAHRGYLDALPEGTPGTDPRSFLRDNAAAVGPALGVEHAVPFELIEL